MAETTRIQPDKLKAYAETVYRIDGADTPILLRIGKHAPELERLFREHGVDSGVFITAYNPLGTIQSPAQNERANAELARALRDSGVATLTGTGGVENPDWPNEPSWFALGLPLEDAKALGISFAQDAIVWIGKDAIPQLITLR